jgi:deazaflavin-dependent oxidoreductase (nitroreductase family)
MIAPLRRPGIPARSLNRLVGLLVGRLGMPLAGAWMLRVRGRRSGRWRTAPVCPVALDGRRYLVAPRGETEWARNLRASRACELRRGPVRRRLGAVEVLGAEREEAIVAYIRRYGWLTGRFFDASRPPRPAEVARIAERHPTFRLE